jgi:glycosyltransferase involved in cell wall biosynthesis
VNKVFNDLKIPLIIAGNDPSEELLTAAKKNPYISIKKNISTNEIYALIRQAQINILPTFQSTGIKLKLLAALFNGRHCIVNSPMVKGTGLEQLCIVADASQAMKEAVNKFFAADLDEQEKTKREKILLRDFSNAANAEKLLSLI